MLALIRPHPDNIIGDYSKLDKLVHIEYGVKVGKDVLSFKNNLWKEL